MDSIRTLKSLEVDSILNRRLNSTPSPSPSPLNWVSQNWSHEKTQFDFTPTFMLDSSNTDSLSVEDHSTSESKQEKERRTPSPVTDEENEEEVSTDEGSWENSSNPSATTEASTSTNSSHQTKIITTKLETSSVSKLEVLDPSVVEALRKKNLSPSIIASAAASPFTPSSLKTIDIKSVNIDSTTYTPITPTASNPQLVNSHSTLRVNSEISNLGRNSPECEWSLNESGLLKSNNEDLVYEIAEEILQLQITPPPKQLPFIRNRNFRIEEITRQDSCGEPLGIGGNHSRHSSHSSSATYESDYSNMTRTSSSSSYITSTTTPDRSSATNKAINNSNPYFSTTPSTSTCQNQSPSSGMRSQYSNSPTSPFYPPQTQSPLLSNNNNNNNSNLYHLALQSFLISSLPPSASTSSDALNDLTISLTTHFNHSMSTAHPLASLYGLSLSEGDTLVRNPRDNGISEEIWRLGVERMKFGLFAEEGREGAGSDWSEFDEEGPSAGNRKFGLYKTELCKSWEEKGMCRYGNRCQFAHGINQVREIARHPKFKSEICRTFWIHGECPYGRRCCFLHTTGPNFNNNSNTSSYNFPQHQQVQYPSISNLADYFEPSSSNIHTRYQPQIQQNHLNNGLALGNPLAFSERPQLSSSTSYQHHQFPYPLTPPYSSTTSPSAFNHLASRTGSEFFSANDYFSSPVSTSSIPCASPPVSRARSGSLLSLEERPSCSIGDSMMGVKKLEPIGAEKMQGKIFSKGLEGHSIQNSITTHQENTSCYNSLGLSLRSLDKTPLAQTKSTSPATPSYYNLDLLHLS